MDRDLTLPLGLATLLLAGCGSEENPAAVQPGEPTGDPAELRLARQIVELHTDIAAVQRRTEASALTDDAAD